MANEKRLIDLDKLIAYFEEQYNIAMEDDDPVSGYVMAALRSCLEYFKTTPTVDAVEVVPCKDCKHLYSGMDDYCCKSHRGLVRICENSFCSYGERKTNDKN